MSLKPYKGTSSQIILDVLVDGHCMTCVPILGTVKYGRVSDTWVEYDKGYEAFKVRYRKPNPKDIKKAIEYYLSAYMRDFKHGQVVIVWNGKRRKYYYERDNISNT